MWDAIAQPANEVKQSPYSLVNYYNAIAQPYNQVN